MKIFNKWRHGKYINSEMLIEWLEGQRYGYTKNHKDWINYVFDFANNGIKNESKIYKDSLDDIYNYPFPIIYKKCPKRY